MIEIKKKIPYIFGITCFVLAIFGVDLALLVGVVGLTAFYLLWR